ncbi:MAG: sensor histidine kinase [Sphingomicrobium sp.]
MSRLSACDQSRRLKQLRDTGDKEDSADGAAVSLMLAVGGKRTLALGALQLGMGSHVKIREKQVLLQELQHRVANSLQIIASVLMQSAKRVQSEETRLHLHDAHSRVMSIAMLQKQLAVTQLKSVELQPYFEDLCRSISASMIDDPQRIALETIVDDTSTNSDVSVSMGLIVTELVINAIKHAFPDRAAGGKIIVSFAADEGGWLLSVSDDGAGIPVGEEEGKPGLGTGIVEALSRQLEASVTVLNANPGTRVEVRHDQS